MERFKMNPEGKQTNKQPKMNPEVKKIDNSGEGRKIVIRENKKYKPSFTFKSKHLSMTQKVEANKRKFKHFIQ